MPKYEFHKEAVPRKNIIEQLRRDAERLDPCQVHLCFTCDPYPANHGPTSGLLYVTHQAIRYLKQNGHSVQILTKSGLDSSSHCGQLDENDEYAATLTFMDPLDSRLWEPHAALPESRLLALDVARKWGITTWASLEPVIYPEQSLDLLQAAIQVSVSKVKVGPLNYKGRLPKWLASTVPELSGADWRRFADKVQQICLSAGVECILKNDLKKMAGLA
jgi:DNA repair photolyase